MARRLKFTRAEVNLDLESGPLRRVSLVIEDVWFSRWDVRNGQAMTITTTADVNVFEPTSRYVVLLSGGPWHRSPLAHRTNSIFKIEADDRLTCHNGTTLYCALPDGFFRSVP